MFFFAINNIYRRGEPVRFRGGILVDKKVKRRLRSPYQELLGILIKSGLKRRAKMLLSKIMWFLFSKKYLPLNAIHYFNIFWEREIFSKITPLFDLNKKKSGPKTMYIPKPIRIKKSRLFAYKWLFFAVDSRKELTFYSRFKNELVAILNMRGYFFLDRNARRNRLQSTTIELCKQWHLQGMENIALMNRYQLPGKSKFKKRKQSKRLSRRMRVFLPSFF